MTEPTLPPPPMPRFWLGWVLVATLFGLLIANSIMELAMPGDGPPPTGNLEIQTRLAFLLKQVNQDMASMSPTSANPDQSKTSFETLEKEALKLAPKDPRAAKFALVAGYEVRKSVANEAVAGLKKSKTELDQQIAAAYEKKSASPDLIQKTAELSSSKKFLDRALDAQLKDMAGDPASRKALIPPGQGWGLMLGGAAAGAAMLAGFALLAIGLVAQFSRRWPTLTLWSPAAGLRDADRYAYRMALFLLAFVTVPVLFAIARSLMPKSLPIDITMGMNAAAFTVILILTVFALQIRVGGVADSWRSIVGRTDKPWTLIGLGVGGFLANLPILIILVGLVSLVQRFLPTPSHPLSESLSQGSTVLGIALSFYLAAVLAPLVEELTFRGLLMPALAKQLKSPVFAILLQGLLFAVIHPQGPAAWPMLMSIGCMAGFLAWKTGSLIPAIVMHAVHNAAILTMITLIT